MGLSQPHSRFRYWAKLCSKRKLPLLQLMRHFVEFAVFITTLPFNRYGLVTLTFMLPVLKLSGSIVIV